MLVATLIKDKIQCAVIKCCEKVIMPQKTVRESHRTNAPLSSDMLRRQGSIRVRRGYVPVGGDNLRGLGRFVPIRLFGC